MQTIGEFCLLSLIASGGSRGQRAREAAHAFSQFYTDEDVAILLLKDCRNVFDQRCVDRISSDDLIAALVESDHNWSWSAYQGPRDDLAPKKLTQGEFARLLRPFGVRSKSMRFKGEDGTRKGYARETFEREPWPRPPPVFRTPRPRRQRQVFAPKTGGTLMTKMITEQDLLDLASMREDYFCSPQHTDSAL